MFRWFVMVGVSLWALQAPPLPAGPEEALFGSDPVSLVEGAELPGKTTLYADFEGFRYLFASEANKKTFDAEPARYAIQFGGSCARMGAPVSASPEIYSVFEGRIYAFGSPACQKAFNESPASYLPRSTTVASPSPDDAQRARDLALKAVAHAGGRERFAKLRAWEESWSEQMRGATATVTARMTLGDVYTERREAELNGRTMQMQIAIDGASAVETGAGRSRPLHEGGRAAQLRKMHRHPMALLAASLRDDTVLVPLGRQRLAGADLEFVRVAWRDVVADLAIAPDGALQGVRYVDRMSSGKYGVIERVIAGVRDVDGFRWPIEFIESHDGVLAVRPLVARLTSVTVSIETPRP